MRRQQEGIRCASPQIHARKVGGGRLRGKRENKELSFYEKQGCSGKVKKSVGSGCFPLCQADTRKMASSKAHALYKGVATMGRGI